MSEEHKEEKIGVPARVRRSMVRLAYGITHPDEELTRLQRYVRYWYELANHSGKQLGRNNAPLMAAALAYRTLFSLVPVMVLSLLVLQSFVKEEQVQSILERLFEFVELDEITVQAQGDDFGESAQPNPAEISLTADGTRAGTGENLQGRADTANTHTSLTDWIERFVEKQMQAVQEISFGSIAVVGVFVFIYAAISLFLQIEGSFNTIYQSVQRRSFGVRIVYSWFAMTLGSIAVAASILMTSGYGESLAEFVPEALAASVSMGTQLGIAWLLFFGAYRLVPSARVTLQAAAIGALVAAVLFQIGKMGLVFFVRFGTGQQVRVYGSLAILPLSLLWLYVTWLIVLFGLQISHSFQTLKSDDFWLRLKQPSHRLVDPLAAVAMLRELAQSFARGETPTNEDLSASLELPTETIAGVMTAMEEGGLVHRVYSKKAKSRDEDPDAYALAKPAESIAVAEALDLLHERERGKAKLPGSVRLVRDRERAALDGLMLSDLNDGREKGA
ncbi:MAG: YihY/virulence factor BrkB family protein [Planctomycetota bacterium]